MEIVIKETLINDICNNCPNRKYTVGYKNNLKCVQGCLTLQLVVNSPGMKVTKKEFTAFAKKHIKPKKK